MEKYLGSCDDSVCGFPATFVHFAAVTSAPQICGRSGNSNLYIYCAYRYMYICAV